MNAKRNKNDDIGVAFKAVRDLIDKEGKEVQFSLPDPRSYLSVVVPTEEVSDQVRNILRESDRASLRATGLEDAFVFVDTQVFKDVSLGRSQQRTIGTRFASVLGTTLLRDLNYQPTLSTVRGCTALSEAERISSGLAAQMNRVLNDTGTINIILLVGRCRSGSSFIDAFNDSKGVWQSVARLSALIDDLKDDHRLAVSNGSDDVRVVCVSPFYKEDGQIN